MILLQVHTHTKTLAMGQCPEMFSSGLQITIGM